MPDANVLASLGLFVIRDFLDPELCTQCRLAALAAPSDQSLVGHADTGVAADREIRQSVRARVPAPTVAQVEARLAALMPALERHFRVTLSGWQSPQFLIYRMGDKFQPHRDRPVEAPPGEDVEFERRKVTMVVFLNGQAEDGGDGFSGGYLTFYGLAAAASMPIPIIAEPGLLVAFRSDLIHAVTPVTGGTRCSIVCWFV
jgi:predicted 2-oxoglutarate/Fe(II)-dependent dioxygenase YbiX